MPFVWNPTGTITGALGYDNQVATASVNIYPNGHYINKNPRGTPGNAYWTQTEANIVQQLLVDVVNSGTVPLFQSASRYEAVSSAFAAVSGVASSSYLSQSLISSSLSGATGVYNYSRLDAISSTLTAISATEVVEGYEWNTVLYGLGTPIHGQINIMATWSQGGISGVLFGNGAAPYGVSGVLHSIDLSYSAGVVKSGNLTMSLGNSFNTSGNLVEVYNYESGANTRKMYVNKHANIFFGENTQLKTYHTRSGGGTLTGRSNLSLGYDNLTRFAPVPGFGESRYNIAIGDYALASASTAYDNVAIGYMAFNSGSTGYHNVAVGVNSLGNSPDAIRSVAIGENALYNGGFSDNVAVGVSSLYKLNGVIYNAYNTALGSRAAQYAASGGFNVYVGSYAGAFRNDGAYHTGSTGSIFVGYRTCPQGENQTNQVVIGFSSKGSGSNTTVIGNDDTTATYLGGKTYTQWGNATITLSSSNNLTTPVKLTLEGDSAGNGSVYKWDVTPEGVNSPALAFYCDGVMRHRLPGGTAQVELTQIGGDQTTAGIIANGASGSYLRIRVDDQYSSLGGSDPFNYVGGRCSFTNAPVPFTTDWELGVLQGGNSGSVLRLQGNNGYINLGNYDDPFITSNPDRAPQAGQFISFTNNSSVHVASVGIPDGSDLLTITATSSFTGAVNITGTAGAPALAVTGTISGTSGTFREVRVEGFPMLPMHFGGLALSTSLAGLEQNNSSGSLVSGTWQVLSGSSTTLKAMPSYGVTPNTSSGQLTVSRDGAYRVYANTAFEAAGTAPNSWIAWLGIFVTGTEDSKWVTVMNMTKAADTMLAVDGIMNLDAGNTIDMRIRPNANIDVFITKHIQFSCVYLGPKS